MKYRNSCLKKIGKLIQEVSVHILKFMLHLSFHPRNFYNFFYRKYCILYVSIQKTEIDSHVVS